MHFQINKNWYNGVKQIGLSNIDYIGLHSIEVKEINEFVVKDVGPDYKYIHGTMECLAGLAAATIHISFDGSEVEHQTSIEEVKTDILVIFSMKYLDGIFDDLEVVEVLFP